MVNSLPIFDKINAAYGVVIAVLAYVFGDHWVVFTTFFALNVVDYITGCLKARINKTTNSEKGAQGIMKKVGYWLMILVAFIASTIFIEIGGMLGIDLSITKMIGWFTIATLIINELRSIIENFVEAGYKVPTVLAKGLEVANRAIDKASDIGQPDDEDTTE